jgi:uncharacterized membrane protein YraQ (UPF0718 family)
MDQLLQVLQAGAGNLAAYLAGHVLLCLLPAFFIAGAMTALIPRSSVTRWLGRDAPARVSYPAAALAGSLIAVCSCTIVPLFAGIHRKGAGLGPAICFLFFAPAGNVMALAYTGSILGPGFAVARLILCLCFGVGIGLLMATIFRHDDAPVSAAVNPLASDEARMDAASLGLLLALLALLVAGTLRLWPLTATLFAVDLPVPGALAWQTTLLAWVPFDAASGEEGVSVQGSVLIALMVLLGISAWRGLEGIIEGANIWTRVALVLACLTLLFATLRLEPHAAGLRVVFTGRTVAIALAAWAVWRSGRCLSPEQSRSWLWEAWRFVKQIFPLLVAGVFVVGMARSLILPEWIEAMSGSNTLSANAIAVGFGVFMYFPTLVEVPVARMFLDLGMHPGPLLAYLMADPELSLQSMLMVAAVIGRRKTAAYVGLVAVFSVCAGLLYGAWIDMAL